MRGRSNVSSKSGCSYIYVGKRRRGKRNICVIQAVDTGTGGSVPPCSFSAGLILGVKDQASEISTTGNASELNRETTYKVKRN